MDVKITGLTVVAQPKPTKNGDTVLARLDAIAGPLVMKGAALVRLPSGQMWVWEPFPPETEVRLKPMPAMTC